MGQFANGCSHLLVIGEYSEPPTQTGGISQSFVTELLKYPGAEHTYVAGNSQRSVIGDSIPPSGQTTDLVQIPLPWSTK